jgi:hypothetical protein
MPDTEENDGVEDYDGSGDENDAMVNRKDHDEAAKEARERLRDMRLALALAERAVALASAMASRATNPGGVDREPTGRGQDRK